MSAKDRIDQQEQEQALSEMSASLERLTSNQNEMLTAMQSLVESQNSLTSMLEELSTSVQSDASSNAPDATLKLGGVKKRLTSLEEAVTALAESLASSQTVQLADGTSLKKSDVDAFKLTEKIAAQITDLRSSLLSEMVSKVQVRVDYEKLATSLAPKLETRLIPEINASEKRMAESFKAQERHLEKLGRTKTAELTEKIQDFTKGLDKGERIVAKLKSALTWAGIGKIAVALLPFVFAAMVWGMLVGVVTQMFGIPQIFHWAWTSFLEAEAWWSKLLIFLATTGSAFGFCWLVYWSGIRAAKSLSRMMT